MVTIKFLLYKKHNLQMSLTNFTEVAQLEAQDSQNCAMFNRIAYLGAATVSLHSIVMPK
jgi:hypothetical protein